MPFKFNFKILYLLLIKYDFRIDKAHPGYGGFFLKCSTYPASL